MENYCKTIGVCVGVFWLSVAGASSGEINQWREDLTFSRPAFPHTYQPTVKGKVSVPNVKRGFEAEQRLADECLPVKRALSWDWIVNEVDERIAEARLCPKDGVEWVFSVYTQLENPVPYYWTGAGYDAFRGGDVFRAAEEFVKAEICGHTPDARVSIATNILEQGKIKFLKLGGESVEIPFARTIFLLVDDRPGSNWSHPCRYVFLNETLTEFVVSYQMNPPRIVDLSSDQRIRLKRCDGESSPCQTLEQIQNTVYSNAADMASNALSYSGDVSKSHFVLISGGADPESNGIRFWADTAMMYSTLTLKYGVPKSQIHVYISDGTSSALDANLDDEDNPVLVSSPTDLDGDGLVDVDGAATKSNVSGIFSTLRGQLTSSDQLFVFITSHGSPDGTAGASNYGCAAWLFSTSGQAYFWDTDLHDWTKGFSCPVAFAIETCYSGGFIDNITQTANRVIATACHHYESSWGTTYGSGSWGTGGAGQIRAYNDWAKPFISAVRGCVPKSATTSNAYPWQNGTSCDADSSGDGFVSFSEAKAYALSNDSSAISGKEHPQYSESTSGLGSSFFFVKKSAVASPVNDNFANATPISGQTGSTTGSNVGATSQSGEPLLTIYSTATTTVWWKWTAPASGSVTIDTVGSSFDTQTGIYTGSSLSSLDLEAKDDDSGDSQTSVCTLDCTAGTTYYICVGGWQGRTGTIKLQWNLTPVADAVDLTFKANDGWPAPVFLSKSSDGSSSCTSYRDGELIYHNVSVWNIGGLASSQRFSVRKSIVNSSGTSVYTTVYTNTEYTAEAGRCAFYWGNARWGAFDLLTPGSYTFKCEVDCYNEISESNEGNNIYLLPFTVTGDPSVLSSISISGSSSVTSGGNATYACTATMGDGSTKTVTPTWSISSGGSYASISSSGKLSAGTVTASQSVTVKASYAEGGVTKTATKSVTINPDLTRETIELGSGDDGATSTTLNNSDGTRWYLDLSSRPSWITSFCLVTTPGGSVISLGSSSSSSVAWTGNAYFSIYASANITGSERSWTFVGKTSSGTILKTFVVHQAAGPTVSLSSISISGSSTVTSGGNTTYTCTATMSDGTTKAVTPTWSIYSGSSYASISTSGKLTANTVTSSQSVTVKASYTEGGVTKTATKSVTINPPSVSLSSISITGPDYVYAGKTGTFTASATMSDSTTKSITPTWSIYSGTSYASISTTGVLTGKTVTSPQSVTVKASYTEGGVTKTATKTVTVYPTFTLATALDNSTLTFTTGGNADWFGQGKTTYDGTDAARSGIITHNQNSWMETTVTGPGTFSFRWYASSEISGSNWYDYLTFSIDGVQTNKIGGTSCSWTQCSYALGAGSHTLRWNYLKDVSQDKGEDAGFVDQVVWTPTPVLPDAPTGVSATDGTYSDKVSISWTGSSGATSYNLYRSTTSTRPSTATKTGVTSPYSDTSATPGTTYYYWVSAVNSAGSSYSSYNTGYRVVSLSVGTTTASFDAAGGTGTATVTANTSWSATADVSWITFTTASGSGNGTVAYTVAASTSTEPRSGTITITAGAGTSHPVTKTITISQSDGKLPDLAFARFDGWDHGFAIFTVAQGGASTNAPLRVFDKGEGFSLAYGYANFGEGVATGTMTNRIELFDVDDELVYENDGDEMIDFEQYWGWSQVFTAYSWEDLEPGAYIAQVSLDAYDQIVEEDEDNNIGTFRFAVRDPVSLNEALDNTTLTFVTDVSNGWFGTKGLGADGVDAAQCTHIGHSSTNSMSTTVTGPGKISFKWKVSSENGYDEICFFVDNAKKVSMSGTGGDWDERSYELSSGTHTLTWSYCKDDSYSDGVDCGWVDQVTWTPAQSAPPAPSSVSATDGTYADKVSISWTGSSGATSYNIYRSTTSTRPSTATKTGVTSPYSDTTATPGTKYYYWVSAVNSAGSSYSSSDTGYRAVSLALGKSSDSYAAVGGNGSASVTANTSWSATKNVSWITLGTSSGSGNGTLNYTVSANASVDSRTGTITVAAGSGTSYPATQTVVITQEGAPIAVATPVISPADGSTFDTDSCTVTITCATEGATIYYSTNGSSPRMNDQFKYTQPFTITDTTTVKAIAVKDGSTQSEIATAVITKINVETGMWNYDYASAKAFAEENDLPLVVFWTSLGCSHCATMIKAFETQKFLDWQADREYVFVYSEGDATIKELVKNDSGLYPFVAVKWPSQEIDVRFTARDGLMPVTEGDLVDQFTQSVDLSLFGVVLSVESDYGSPMPSVGDHMYMAGSIVTAAVETVVIEPDGRTQHVCVSGEGTGSAPATISSGGVVFEITADSTLVWNWYTQNMLTILEPENGTIGGAESGWVLDDASKTLTAVPDSGYKFDGWTGDTDGCTIDGSTITVPMSKPRQIGATFVQDVQEQVATPVITPADGSSFDTDSCTVEITCATPGATIYYSTNGSSPRLRDQFKYTQPFAITGTTTIMAVAVKDGFTQSEIATATITKVDPPPPTLTSALDEPKLSAVGTDGDAEWEPVKDVTAVGGSSARSGEIGMLQRTCLKATVYGKGTLSFNWRVSCEDDYSGLYTYDHLTFSTVEGGRTNDIAKIDGETEWLPESVTFTTDGPHVILWTYSTDDWEEPGFEDCGWVDNVAWSGDSPPPFVILPKAEVEAFMAKYPSLAAQVGGDAEAFAKLPSATGKLDANGNQMYVWQDIIAGTDPTNPDDKFKIVDIKFVDGELKITWSPDLNEGGKKNVRAYTEYGRKELDGSEKWTDMQDVDPAEKNDYKFRKVTVDMP